MAANRPEGAFSDAALLTHGMMCIAGADGSFAEPEMRLVEAFFVQLPELRGQDFDLLMDEARAIIEQHGSSRESLSELRALSTPALKTKLYLLAVDIALATGRIDARENEMLQALKDVLEIEAATAARIEDVLQLKYV